MKSLNLRRLLLAGVAVAAGGLSVAPTLAAEIPAECAAKKGGNNTFGGYDTVWNNADKFGNTMGLLDLNGTVSHHVLDSQVPLLEDHSPGDTTEVGYVVYLPPQYSTNSNLHFPVTYLFHGNGGTEVSADGIVEEYDRKISLAEIPPQILVVPNAGNSTMGANHAPVPSVDAVGLQVHDMLIDELLPLIDATYRTIPDRYHRTVSGFSMGGSVAHMLGTKHADLFAGSQSFGGALHSIESFPDARNCPIWYKMFDDDVSYFEQFSPQFHATDPSNTDMADYRIEIWTNDADNSGATELSVAYRDHLAAHGVSHNHFDDSDYPELVGVGHQWLPYYTQDGVPTEASAAIFDFHQRIFGGQGSAGESEPQSISDVSATMSAGGSAPSDAIDNDTATTWKAFGLGTALTFELAAPVVVDSLEIDFAVSARRQAFFELEFSVDGANFEPAGSFASAGNIAGFETFDAVSPTPVSHVRLINQGNSGPNNSVAIQELHILGQAAVVRPVLVTSTNGSPVNNAAMAIDLNDATAWTATANSDHITFDFGEARDLSRVTLSLTNDDGTSVPFRVSTAVSCGHNGLSPFSEVAAPTTSGVSTTETFAFAETSAQCLRLRSLGATGDAQLVIREASF